MGLRNLTFPTYEVQTAGGNFAVRGLGFDHLLTLFQRHGLAMVAQFNAIAEKIRGGAQLSEADVATFLVQAIDAAPQLVAEAIALASGSIAPSGLEDSDDPILLTWVGDVVIARGLPVGAQMDALEKIALQTFTSDMPPGKMLALIQKTLQAGGISAAPSREVP